MSDQWLQSSNLRTASGFDLGSTARACNISWDVGTASLTRFNYRQTRRQRMVLGTDTAFRLTVPVLEALATCASNHSCLVDA